MVPVSFNSASQECTTWLTVSLGMAEKHLLHSQLFLRKRTKLVHQFYTNSSI